MGRNPDIPWLRIIERVWQRETVPDACEQLGLKWAEVNKGMDQQMRGFLVDLSMVARYRDEELLKSG